MARPRVKELTQRELEIMHAFWRGGELTAAQVREQLAAAGRNLAYTTVATLVRILLDKGYLKQTNQQRPFTYRPAQLQRRLAADRGRPGEPRVSRLARRPAASIDGRR